MTNLWRYLNGQQLAYCELGAADGFPVLVQHGLIASIRETGLFDGLVAAGRRVISLARPGYGDSSPYVLANLGEWGEMAGALARALRLARFDVLGLSSGAPYSYAIGWRLPEQVRHIYILSGTPALYDPEIQARWPFPLNTGATLAELQALAEELFFRNLPAEDLLQEAVRDSRRNDCFGIAQDLKLRGQGWGFTLAEVRAPVWMQHSRADDHVPFVTAELTARRLPRCSFRATDDAAHFSSEILDGFIERVMLADPAADRLAEGTS